MIALSLGLAWAAAVALVLGERRRPTRLPGPRPAAAASEARTTGWPLAAVGRAAVAAVAGLGGWLRRRAGRPDDPEADRRVGWAVLATAALAPWAPPLAVVPGAWAVLSPALATRRARRAHEAAVTDQLPDVVDLLALTAMAGLPIAAALCAIRRRPGGPLGVALERAAVHIERGGTTAGALGSLVEVAGPPARPLMDALAAHDRYGTPLTPALERVALESRLRRRRQAEEAARRLPVTLLFPLVLTTLPAFALLTVVPLLAGSFGSLSP
ncbi:MAG TPA: type II secretion system F family protein [Acidimicrobiales bacterium]|nr:type II secretion system F family protein [Acidimicrobiales bacterium]